MNLSFRFFKLIFCMVFINTAVFSQVNSKLSVELSKRAEEIYLKEAEISDVIFSNLGNKYPEAGEGVNSELFCDPLIILGWAIQEDSTNSNAYFLKALILFKKANIGEGMWDHELLETSILFVEKAIKLDPNSIEGNKLRKRIELILRDD